MGSTIAVALITSVSTLMGATISGLITFAVTRTQSENQLKLADREHKSRLAQDKRGIRRDVYVQFLNRASLIEGKLGKWWSTPYGAGTTSEDCLKEFHSDVEDIAALLNLVQLEGPEEVSDAFNQFYLRFPLEIMGIIYGLGHCKEGQTPATSVSEAHSEQIIARQRARSKAVRLAHKTLDAAFGD